MKKRWMSLLVVAILLVFAAGCASDDHLAQGEENQAAVQGEKPEETEAEPEPEAVAEQTDKMQDNTKERLEECLALIGKDDAAAAEFLGGGEEDIADIQGTAIICNDLIEDFSDAGRLIFRSVERCARV